MVKRITPLPAANAVAAGQTATLDIPVGPRYHVIWLVIANAATEAFTSILGDIRLKVNGKVQRTMSAAQLDALNKLNGSIYGAIAVDGGGGAITETRLPIYLAEPWRKQVQAVDGLAWATGDLATFQVELDLLANVSAPTIRAYAEVDNSVVTGKDNTSRQAPLGVISKWFRTNIPITGTTQEIQTFPKRDNYQALSFFDPNGGGTACLISDIEVDVENFMIRKVSKLDNDATLTVREMTPAATRFDLVFDHDDILNSALPMVNANKERVQDFQVKLTLSDGTPRNIPCIYQVLGYAE
jgi:hypothetical protein